MQIIRKGFKILSENEIAYFNLLEGIINSNDELSSMEIRKNPNNYQFRIAISSPIYIPMLIESLNELHKMLNIHLNYQKSMKKSCNVAFTIDI